MSDSRLSTVQGELLLLAHGHEGIYQCELQKAKFEAAHPHSLRYKWASLRIQCVDTDISGILLGGTKGKPSEWPDVCVAFNSGAAQTSQESWSATLKVLVDRKIPILFTALYRAEAEGEAVLLQAAGTTLHPELGLTKNPRGSLNERSSPTTPVRSELELSSVNENSNRGPIRNIKKDRRRTSDAIPKIRLPSRAPVESSAVQYRGVTRIQRAGGWGGIPFSWKLNWKRIDTETRSSRQRLPRQPDEAALGHREDRENGELESNRRPAIRREHFNVCQREG
ncbi:hypothetical protein B0H16DRAFT_1479245 [Mycena metata]|uniref:Mitochondrial splicing suppressor 51-like C-terminal domain-containing protein n=1 Tax=Mycena metata TaxID=1033252 RepID=A0AAD7H550_9AGAR|nr:hypothetical protein B0H16DRAFT_1479245 [Mycena metata]